MSDATKAKLVQRGLAPAVVEKLAKAGILFPHQLRTMKDSDLKKILTTGEVTALRLKIKERK